MSEMQLVSLILSDLHKMLEETKADAAMLAEKAEKNLKKRRKLTPDEELKEMYTNIFMMGGLMTLNTTVAHIENLVKGASIQMNNDNDTSCDKA